MRTEAELDGPDQLQLSTPVEFCIGGVPVSLQGSPASLRAWQDTVRQASLEGREGWEWLLEGPVQVTIYYFSSGAMAADLDNIVKPILDAMNGTVYVDDHQVERLVVQKFEPGRILVTTNPSITLAGALGQEPPILYVRIDDERSRLEGVT